MEAAPEPSLRVSRRPLSWAGALLAVSVGATLLLATFAGDGSDVDGILPVGGAAALLLGIALLAAAIGRPVLPRLHASGFVLVGSLVLLAAWTGATVVWSIAPDRSWEALNRSLAFAAFLGLGIVLAGVAGRFAARVGAVVLSATLAVVLVAALATKVVPSLDPEGDRVARLREPVDYWNALALLADVALVLGLWLATSFGRSAVLRVAGGLLVYIAVLALALTLSRAGIAAAVAVVALWLVLTRDRLQGTLTFAAAAIPAAVVAGWAFTRPALVEDRATRADRVDDGVLLGLLGAAGALVVVALLVVGSRRALRETTHRRLSRGLLAVAAVAVAVGVTGLGFATGSAANSSSCAEIANDPSRLGSVDVTNRWCWWNEAWDVFAANSPEGAGAGSFVVARKRYREDARNVVQPHSVPLQQLADGGVAGLGLFVLLVLAAGWTCVAALWRLRGPERAAAAALVAAPVAYLLHSLVDYDWDFLAVTAPTMFALGVLAGAGRDPARRRRRPILGIGVVLLVATVLFSFSSPRLSDEYVRDSTRELDDGTIGDAALHALRAKDLNPLSIAPWFALARVDERAGSALDAEERYVSAVELQPENPETWYALGLFEFQVRGNLCAAYEFLNNAYTLDPKGRQWFPGGPLDVARDAVNEGACEPG